MLYKLNLTSLDSFAELLEKAEITINYRPYSNFIEIMSDTESLIARNQRDILNITSLVNSINKIDKSDLLWVKYEDDYILAKIEGKLVLDENKAEIKLPCTIYFSEETPDIIKNIFDDIKIALVENNDIRDITEKILRTFEDKEEKDACEVEFIKNEGQLVEIKEEITDIMPYTNDISFIKETKKKSKKKKVEDDPNRGEIIIELYPPKEEIEFQKLPVKISDNNKIKDPKDFYVEIMEKQVEFYMGLQRETMNNFLKMEEELWKKFFEIIK